jgi:transcriptional regulator with XRE-family HTH domain
MRTDKYIYGFGDRLKQKIKEKGMTDAEFQRRCGLTGKSAVYRITMEHKMPCVSVLVKMANVLNVSTDWLLGLSSVEN